MWINCAYKFVYEIYMAVSAKKSVQMRLFDTLLRLPLYSI